MQRNRLEQVVGDDTDHGMHRGWCPHQPQYERHSVKLREKTPFPLWLKKSRLAPKNF